MSMSTFGIRFYSLKSWIASVNLLVRDLLLCEWLGVIVFVSISTSKPIQ